MKEPPHDDDLVLNDPLVMIQHCDDNEIGQSNKVSNIVFQFITLVLFLLDKFRKYTTAR